MANKKATIGATMTWILATIIVLVIIVLFVIVSFSLGKEREAEETVSEIKSAEFLTAYSSIDSEQMLLALLDTKIGSNTFRENIENKDYNKFNEDYEDLKKSLESLLVKFPKQSSNLKWGLAVDYYEKPKFKSMEYFYFGIEKMEFQDWGFTAGNYCSLVYLKNAGVIMCQFT